MAWRILLNMCRIPCSINIRQVTTATRITIRYSKPGEVKDLVRLMREEKGWDNTEFDCNAALAISPNAIIVAADHNDNAVGFFGVCPAVKDTIYLAHWIVHKSVRGKGVGGKLWAAMMDHTGSTNTCLDGVENMVDYYKARGYGIESFKIRNFTGLITAGMKQTDHTDKKYQIVPLNDRLWPALLNYDNDVYNGVDREKILRAWFTGDCVYAVVALANNAIAGFGSVINANVNEFCIQTLSADNDQVVNEILCNMISKMPVGATVTFSLLADKPIPACFREFKETVGEQRLFSHYELSTKREKMFLINHHTI